MGPLRLPLHSLLPAALTLLASFGLPLRSPAADWPEWRGPDRDGLSKETGLLSRWPSGGPSLLFMASGLGEGFSSVSVASGRIFTMGNRGKQEFVIALEVDGGQQAWSIPTGPVRSDGSGYPGPRCTPTVDGTGNRALVYALGLNGDLVCLEAASGRERWRKDLRKEFKGSMPGWGYSESPLVDGDRVLVTPGGRDATIVALDKGSGRLIWKSAIPRGDPRTAHDSEPGKLDGAQYSSIIAAELEGVKQYVQFLKTGVAGISAKDGKFIWRYNKSANDTANVSTPIIHGNLVFTASGYGVGGGLVKVSRANGGLRAQEVYFTGRMKNHHGGVVLVDKHLYGFDEGVLRCLDLETGASKWANRSVGKGSLVYADGHLYARSEGGPVALVEATPERYVEKGRFDQPDRSGKSAWPHPVISDGRLYLRDQDLLLVYDLKEGGAVPAKTSAGR